MRLHILIATGAIVSIPIATAQTGKKEKKGLLAKMEGSEFHIEEDLVDKFYDDSSLTATKTSSAYSSNSELSPQIGVMSLNQLTLENDYFTADYAENLGSVPLVSFAIANELISRTYASLYAQGSFGYAYKQGTYELTSTTGNNVEDTITFQWIPIHASSRVDFRIPKVAFVTPSLEAGIGTNWFHQSGTIDGVDQGYWVSVYQGAMALTFFGGSKKATDTFGGVTVKSKYQKSISEDQPFSGWYHNIGTKILL